VPKERVRLDVTRHRGAQVSEEVRSEQIEVEGDETSTRRGDNL
jgi:hypothetical protein